MTCVTSYARSAANRFSQEMTEMRDQARRLDEDQKKLSEQLDAAKDRPPTSLRDTGERKHVAEGLVQQQKNLDKLLDQMRNTVQNAEETEPLLAKNLYRYDPQGKRTEDPRGPQGCRATGRTGRYRRRRQGVATRRPGD